MQQLQGSTQQMEGATLRSSAIRLMRSLNEIEDFGLYLFLLVSALIVFRQPAYFLRPRIWAEEGAVYLQAALDQGVWSSVIAPHIGYYSLFPNVISSIGVGLLGLSHVAYLTTVSSAIVILAVISFPIVFDSPYWPDNTRKALIVAASLVGASGEIWLNTITSQFFFCLFACYVILAGVRHTSGFRRIYLLTILALGALTSATTVVLLPFFVWTYWKRSRSRFELSIVFVVLAGLLVQFAALAYLHFYGQGVSRLSLSNLHALPKGFLFIASGGLLGFIPKLRGVLLIAILLWIAISGILAVRDSKPTEFVLPAVIAVYLCVVFSFLSLDMTGADRYAFAPSVMFFISLLSLCAMQQRWSQLVSGAVLTVLLLGSAAVFFQMGNFYDRTWVPYSVEACQAEPTDGCKIRLFPQWAGHKEWYVTVPPGRSTP